jgi:hypothetical protein
MNFINIFNQTLSDSNILYLYNNPSYGQTTEGGLMTIGIENDSPYNDRIALWPNSGTGYVGINTKTPQATLDINGTLNINGIITNNSGAVGITADTGTVLTLKNTSNVGARSEVNIDFMTQTGNYGMARISALDTTVNTNGSIGGYDTSMRFSLAGVNAVTEYMKLTSLGVDISGRILISETGAGTTGNAAVGSLTLQHATNGASSIVFRSATNSSSDYAYIRYQDHNQTTDFTGTAENGLLTIGIENDGSTGGSSDRIVLWACDNGTTTATGFVGINTKNPKFTLDVNGNVNAISYNATSDYRIKKNVAPLDLTFTVDVLKPVSYVLKDDKDSKLHIGFIAHEVQEFYPFLVNGEKDGKDTQSINYNGFIGILTNEIQVLKKKVADQERKALDQDQRIQELEKMMLDLINK